MKKLLIVESPNKCKKISFILDKLYGAGVWKVVASVGHFRDLPLKSLGVHRDQGYGLSYELHPDKLKIVKDIKGLAQQVGIANCYLATDLDREGESISFHLAQVLSIPIPQTKRVTFDEVTEKAIAAAVSNPRVLDMKLVSAQEGRRAIDRLTGYEISPLMSRKLGNRISAGRVQSVALRLVVERERTIEAFKTKFDFRLKGEFMTPAGEGLKATYHQPFLTEDAILSYLKASVQKTYSVANIEVKPLVRQPSPPFTTSTLQQDAIRKLSKKTERWSAKKVMEVAQELFAKGHITYMRTDSPTLSQEAIDAITEQVSTRLGPSYFEARTFKAKQAAQEAHEAIRPTHFAYRQAGDTPDEQALYDLIYRRAMASQMKPALFEQTTICITSADPEDLFTAVAKVEKFIGYLAVYAEETSEEEEDETTSLKKIAKGDKLRCQKLIGRQTYNQPAKRYDEASLVHELEKRDIGRPSTYATIVGTVQARDYVRTDSIPASKLPAVILTLENNRLEKKVEQQSIGGDQNKLVPSAVGHQVTEYLEANFSKLVDYAFTASMEKRLDEVAGGKASYKQVVSEFDTDHQHLLQLADASQQDVVRTPSTLEVGELNGEPVKTGKGKYGTYVLYKGEFLDARQYEPDQITLDLVVQLLEKKTQQLQQRQENLIHKAGKYEVRQGPHGQYVTDGTTNARLPQQITTTEQIKQLTGENCQSIISRYLTWKKSQAGSKGQPKRVAKKA